MYNVVVLLEFIQIVFHILYYIAWILLQLLWILIGKQTKYMHDYINLLELPTPHNMLNICLELSVSTWEIKRTDGSLFYATYYHIFQEMCALLYRRAINFKDGGSNTLEYFWPVSNFNRHHTKHVQMES